MCLIDVNVLEKEKQISEISSNCIMIFGCISAHIKRSREIYTHSPETNWDFLKSNYFSGKRFWLQRTFVDFLCICQLTSIFWTQHYCSVKVKIICSKKKMISKNLNLFPTSAYRFHSYVLCVWGLNFFPTDIFDSQIGRSKLNVILKFVLVGFWI